MVKTEGIKLSKKDKERIRQDLIRPLRVIEYLDFSRIYDNAPVEVIEGYTVADTDTGECFAVFKIQNTSGKELAAVNVRLLLYEGKSNIPTRRIDYTYKAENKNLGIRYMPEERKKPLAVRLGLASEKVPRQLRTGESFGEGTLIKLPYSYCRKLEFELRSVEYTDGTKEVINIVSGKKYTAFKELDEDLRYAYTKLNVFYRHEEEHPIKNIPQASDKVWLCCCGNKNLKEQPKCIRCGRDMEWQLNNITEETLNNELDRIRASGDLDYTHRHKVEAGKQLSVESEEERKRKAAAVEKALKNVAQQEKNRKDGRRLVLLLILVLVVLYFVLQYAFAMIEEFSVKENGNESGNGAQTDNNGGNDGGDDAPPPTEVEYNYGKDLYVI